MRPRRHVVTALVVVVALGAAVSIAESRPHRPPKIYPMPTATYHQNTGTVAFDVEVGRRPRRVIVFHGGHRLPAKRVPHLQRWWETHDTPATKKRCYHIRVKARNRFGRSERRLRAGRIGSQGCR